MTLIKDPNPAELTDLVAEFKTASMLLMHRMLDLIDPEIVKTMALLQRQGWRMAMEMAADEAGAWTVTMTAVSSDGIRKPIAEVAKS